MNDFTKEDLEYLEQAVQFHIEEDYQQNPALNVLDKIQSMIDNYCDHQSNGELIVLSAHPYLDAYKCNKCEKLYK